jgi:signal peptidase II
MVAPMVARVRGLLVALVVAGLLVAADAASKRWAEDELRPRGARSLLGGTVELRYGINRGIAFGLFKGHLHPHKEALFTGYAAACTLALTVLLVVRALRGRGRPVITAGLTALLAGSAGNLWDRHQGGGVVDFIDIGVGQTRWPAFNLADLYLTVGLVLCVWGLVQLSLAAAPAPRSR